MNENFYESLKKYIVQKVDRSLDGWLKFTKADRKRKKDLRELSPESFAQLIS